MDIINSRIESDVLSSHFLDITSRGGVKISILCTLECTSWWHHCHHGSRLHPGQKRAATSSTRVSISNHHHCHRQVIMTTATNDNHHGDQDDMRGEDLPPHLNHPGMENAEITPQFHKNAGYIDIFAVCGFCHELNLGNLVTSQVWATLSQVAFPGLAWKVSLCKNADNDDTRKSGREPRTFRIPRSKSKLRAASICPNRSPQTRKTFATAEREKESEEVYAIL